MSKIIIIWAFLLLTQGIGCTASTTPSPEDVKKPFQFDPKQVQEIVINKVDPSVGDSWIASLQKQGTTKFWTIASSSGNHPEILDRQADETLILHLLDTFRTLALVRPAPPGTLDSFQLDPPHFGIQWKTPNQGFEIEVGAALKNSDLHYIRLNRKNVYIAQGASFKILQHLQSFQNLRKLRWSDIRADDIDEIEIRIHKKFILYAQREGDRWTDKNHLPLHQDFDTFLNQVTESKSEEWVDQPDQVQKLKPRIINQPWLEAQLIPRKGKSNWIRIIPIGKSYYGMNSSRPETVFALNPKTVNTIQNVIGSKQKL